MAKKPRPPSGGGKGRQALESLVNENLLSKRELIVIARSDYGLRAAFAQNSQIVSSVGADVTPLSNFLAAENVTLRPLFGLSEERMKDRTASLARKIGEPVPELSTYYHIEAPEERLDALADSLGKLDALESAYVKPPSEPPVTKVAGALKLNVVEPKRAAPPLITPDFVGRQIFLSAAPAGIDAHYAWTINGGSGSTVKIIDCEWGWRFTHEDLLQNAMGVVVGTGLSYSSDPMADTSQNRAVNHGTAVIGEISGDRNSFGITGICPDATIGAASFVNKPSAQTIREAADRLRPGDIILLEIHRAGPRYQFQGRDDQLGYIAIEWWPDDYDAIRYATSKGIIVVEAAGNGAEDLDDALYNKRPAGFPATWQNPFNPASASSGAVIVGAGAPPPGTHGRDHGPDRSRLGFSNYGARVDCQGWGREVTTTGYGNLQGGTNTDEWYSDTFGGTSSASPIVVGALGCLQGILRARAQSTLTPGRAINLLRSTGSPQQDAPGRPRTQRIGNRPDLRQLIAALASSAKWQGWEDLGGVMIGAPAVASWAPDRLDCFVRGTDNRMYHKWWDGGRWQGWEDLGGTIVDAPAAVSWGPHRIDCFAPGSDNHLYHKWWDGHLWQGWEDLGGVMIGSPAAASRAPNRLDCFVRGTSNHMYHKWWDGSIWHAWEDLGGLLAASPAVVSWGPDRIDCFAAGTDNRMYRKWWDGHAWLGWEDLGGLIIGAPAVASWAPNRLDCFARGIDNRMYHKWWDGSQWQGWEDLGGVIVGAPGAVSWGQGRIDCFAAGTNNHMYHKWYA